MDDLQRLAARAEIDDLLTRYTLAVDSWDFEWLGEVFTPDAHIDYTGSGGIAYMAHLGGMLFGFLYLKGGRVFSDVKFRYDRWQRNRLRRKFDVYYNERRRDDDDQQKWRRWKN